MIHFPLLRQDTRGQRYDLQRKASSGHVQPQMPHGTFTQIVWNGRFPIMAGFRHQENASHDRARASLAAWAFYGD